MTYVHLLVNLTGDLLVLVEDALDGVEINEAGELGVEEYRAELVAAHPPL